MIEVQQMPARLARTLREIADATLSDHAGRAVEIELSTDPHDAPGDCAPDAREDTSEDTHDGTLEARAIVSRWTR